MKSKLKKLLITASIILAISASFGIITTASTYADGFEGRQGSACPEFLGLTSWDCGVVIKDEESLKSGIWQIAANIATDATVIASYLIIGYVIYGGYRYMFSQGDPTKIATGKKTLVQAFIGLAIVMSAYVIMGGIRIALVGGNGNIGSCATTTCIDPNQMVDNLITWVISVAGIVAAVFLIYGGVSYIMSSGDPAKVKKAKDTILYSVIGLIIVALAFVISSFVSNTIREANKNAQVTLPNQTIISKEITHHDKIH